MSTIATLGHLYPALETLSSAMETSNLRFRVAVENMTNAESTSDMPGGDPYSRKLVSFVTTTDHQTGAEVLKLQGITHDPSDFRIEYIPGHPAADEEGRVKFPNVNRMTEMVDAQEANLAMRAASQVYRLGTEMIRRTNSLIDTTKSA